MWGRKEFQSADRLSGVRLAEIDEWLDADYIRTGRLPGAVLLIAERDRVVHERALGRMGYDGPAMRANAVFRIFSMTKSLTSVAVLRLVEDRKLKLDDPAARYLPALARLRVAGSSGLKSPVSAPTVADLLRHTAGLTYGFQYRTAQDARHRELKLLESFHGHSLDEFIEALADIPLEAEPGAAWIYSVATDVLGRIAEVVSGEPFETHLTSRVLAPLGMTETGFSVRPDQVERLPDCYMLGPDGRPTLFDAGADSAWSRSPLLASGGGGLVSTARDYLRFCRFLLKGGEVDGRAVLKPGSVRMMMSNQLPGGRDLARFGQGLFSGEDMTGVGFGYGLAVNLTRGPRSSIGSAGWGGMAGTEFWVDPVEKLSVVFMTQMIPSLAYPIRHKLRERVYAALRSRRS